MGVSVGVGVDIGIGQVVLTIWFESIECPIFIIKLINDKTHVGSFSCRVSIQSVDFINNILFILIRKEMMRGMEVQST